jgi:hypothetical protein
MKGERQFSFPWGIEGGDEIHQKLMPLNLSINIDPKNSCACSINILSGLNTNI